MARRSLVLGALAVAGLGGVVAAPATALAQAPARTVIVVAPEPTPPLPLGRLLAALDSQLAELGVDVVLSSAPPGSGGPDPASSGVLPRDVLAVVWFERVPDALVVHFYEPAGASLRERRIPVSDADAASLEEVAVVVRSAVGALLERASAPAPAPAPPPAPSPPAPSPPAPSPPAPAPRSPAPLRLGLAYVGTAYADGLPWQHGARLDAAVRLGPSRWWLGVAYAWFPPLHLRTDAVAIALYRHPFEGSVGFAVPLGDSRFTLRPEGAVGADPLLRRTERTEAALTGTSATTRWSFAASTRLRLIWQATRGFGLQVAGGADFALSRVENTVGDQVLLSPLPARPVLEAGLSGAFP